MYFEYSWLSCTTFKYGKYFILFVEVRSNFIQTLAISNYLPHLLINIGTIGTVSSIFWLIYRIVYYIELSIWLILFQKYLRKHILLLLLQSHAYNTKQDNISVLPRILSKYHNGQTKHRALFLFEGHNKKQDMSYNFQDI